MSLIWKPCSSCKKPIQHGQTYYICSVSTCNRARTGLVFCTIDCWDAHVPMMNHRDAWAEEQKAPPPPQDSPPAASENRQVRRIVRPAGTSARQSPDLRPPPEPEVLVVASRLKVYIQERSGDMSTAADVLDHLSDLIRQQCDDAIRRARSEGRRTVKARDFMDRRSEK